MNLTLSGRREQLIVGLMLGAYGCAVALAPGATISGPVDGSAEFSNAAAVPEPSSLVLLSTLVLAVALIARKSWAHRPATRTSG